MKGQKTYFVYLPDSSRATDEFIDEQLALSALEQIRKHHPEARLFEGTQRVDDDALPGRKEKLEIIRQREAAQLRGGNYV